MFQNKLAALALLAMLVIFNGCTSRSYLNQAKQETLPSLNLPYQVQHIEVLDKRTESSAEEMKLPIVSRPGQLILHRPSITPAHQQVIESVIKDNVSNAGQPVKVVITIQESYKEFSSTWSSEKEKGFAQVQIMFIDAATGDQLTGCESQGEFFLQSMDATPKKMEEVYQVTLKRAIHTCLKFIKNT